MAAGYSEEVITFMGNLNQMQRSGGPDSDAAAAARNAGYEIFKRSENTSFEEILTKPKVRQMQDPVTLYEGFYWPDTLPAEQRWRTSWSDVINPPPTSLFVRPEFLTPF